MARVKIDYGIDLGTTNSAIARMESGESVIKRTKSHMDTLPSCVYFARNKKGEKSIRVGVKARDSRNSDAIQALSRGNAGEELGYIEFKREMGSDRVYENANMSKAFYTPEELSAEVLKELKSQINDEQVDAVVITVPAMFTAIQKDATMKAAKLAGFSQCALLQEPIAACMAYGLSAEKKDGKWLVFDFGGGTFDAALVRVEDGILTVFDTAGDNYLGGKNLDEAVVNHILLPHLEKEYDLSSYKGSDWKKKALTDALKGPAEEMRIQLSFNDETDYSTYDRNLNLGEDDNGEEIFLEITMTKDQLLQTIRDQYQKAVDLSKELLKRNHISGRDLDSLILVGGPTLSPIVQQMLKEQVTPNVSTEVDPMTAVARGAALYASTIDAQVDEQAVREQAKSEVVFLNIGYESTSVLASEWVSIDINQEKSGPNCPESLSIELQRADGAWRSDKTEIDQKGNVIEAFLLEGKPNTFRILAYDPRGNAVETFPAEITIIQGVKVGAAPLPYNIGIEVYSDAKQRGVFMAAKGLEKNKPLPAVGIVHDRKTSQDLRPGVSTDILSVPVYQVDGLDAEGKTAALYTKIADVTVTGDEVESLIPAGSNVDITLHADASEMMTMEVYFQEAGFTVKKKLDLGKRESHEDAQREIQRSIRSAQSGINSLRGGGVDTQKLESELESVKELASKGEDAMRTLSNVKEILRQIENLESGTEWQRVEAELRSEFSRLETAQSELGDADSGRLVEQLRTQTDSVIRAQDVKLGREVIQQIGALFFRITMLYQLMGMIRHYHEIFSSVRWKDAARARQLINRGLEEMNNQPTADSLQPIVGALFQLMPDDEARNASGGLLK